MAEKLGEIFVELKALDKSYNAALKQAKANTIRAATGMQKKFDSLNMARARKAVRAFGTATKRVLTSVKRAVFSLKGAFITLGAGLVFKNIIKIGMDFDRSMNIVQVVSHATAQEFKELTAIAKKMGEQTEFTASQAADALKFLSMAGLTATQSIKALPQMLDLATAGQIDLARAADISTNIMTMMGLRVEELTRVNDAFVAVQATANTNIEELAQAFIFAGPKAKAFGVDVEQLTSLIGLLANAGIKGTLGGTTLRQSMMRLLDPTKDATEILKKYGINIVDSTGKLRPYLDILKDLADANLDVIQVTKLFGARAGNIQVILDQGSVAIQKYIDKIKSMGGEAATAAEIIRSDTKGAFDELKSTIESVALKIWDKYRDKVKATMKTITEFIRKHRDDFVLIVGTMGSAIGFVFKTVWTIFEKVGKAIAWVVFKITQLIDALNDSIFNKILQRLSNISGGKTAAPGGQVIRKPIPPRPAAVAPTPGAPVKPIPPQGGTGTVFDPATGRTWTFGDIPKVNEELKKVEDTTKKIASGWVQIGDKIYDITQDGYTLRPKIAKSPAVDWQQGIDSMMADLEGIGSSMTSTMNLSSISALIMEMKVTSGRLERIQWLGSKGASSLGLREDRDRTQQMWELQMKILKNFVASTDPNIAKRREQAAINITTNAQTQATSEEIALAVRRELERRDARGL